MLDCSNRINLNEGRMVVDMFSQIPSTQVEVFSVRYGQWPSVSNASLQQVDDILQPIVEKDDPTKFAMFPVTVCNLNVAKPSPQDVIAHIGNHFDGIVIGGSQDSCMNDTLPYIPLLLEVIRLSVEKDIPLLGICFGAQAIYRALYGDSAVSTMAKKGLVGEFGVIQVTLTETQNTIFKNVPTSFHTTISHADCFLIVDEKNKLAKTRNWDNQAYQINGKRTWGLQFHPEFKALDTDILTKRVADRDGTSSHIHRDAQEPDANVTRTIAENFVHEIRNN
jgi:GMP synthase-like glutamine amidotransferase